MTIEMSNFVLHEPSELRSDFVSHFSFTPHMIAKRSFLREREPLTREGHKEW